MKAHENPFSTDRVERIRYRIDEREWLEILDQARQHQYRASVIGPEGSGKTTFLEDLGKRLCGIGLFPKWYRVTREAPYLPWTIFPCLLNPANRSDLVLFDGAEQLPTWQWFLLKQLSQTRAGLLITSHVSGYLPRLRECSTTLSLFTAIALDLESGMPAQVREQLPVLFRRHSGNIRECLRELYDIYCHLPASTGIGTSPQG